ncbi:MAG: MFS transporter, partial [Pseudomonadota bacterium]
MLADTADEHELESGVRREGVIYSVRAFSGKATAAFGTLFGGSLLSVIEFPAGAARGSVDPETVWNLGLIAGPATSIFSLAALGFYLMYKINAKRHQEIVTALEARRASQADSTTSAS